MTEKRVKKLLVTGAAGVIGRAIRAMLEPIAETLRLSDRAGLGKPLPMKRLSIAS